MSALPGSVHTAGTLTRAAARPPVARDAEENDRKYGGTRSVSDEAAVTGPEAGGDARVAAALARLEELRELDVSEHVEVLSDVHSRLHEALAELDGN